VLRPHPEPLHPTNPFSLTDTKDTNTPPSRSAHSNQPAMSTSLRAISQGPVRHTPRLSISDALHSLRDRAVRYRDHLVHTLTDIQLPGPLNRHPIPFPDAASKARSRESAAAAAIVNRCIRYQNGRQHALVRARIDHGACGRWKWERVDLAGGIRLQPAGTPASKRQSANK
jgi:hypothetical protein